MKTDPARFRAATLVTLSMAGLLALSASFSFPQRKSPTAPKDARSAYVELERVPEKARAERNPLEGDPDAVAAGRKLFEQHCAECHGYNAEGGKRAPSLRAKELQQTAPGALFWILTNGVVRRGMPVWSKLPEPQRWQIVTYLKAAK